MILVIGVVLIACVVIVIDTIYFLKRMDEYDDE